MIELIYRRGYDPEFKITVGHVECVIEDFVRLGEKPYYFKINGQYPATEIYYSTEANGLVAICPENF